ncbi:MAG: helix-turn-helix domain-containing protein, partial [Deltaproteobacteria bacterium]|nr:helix-turn-helix domain-containing protein [Deltaproteobacteria bacterium]
MPGARLCLEEREQVSRGLAAGHSLAEIGRQLARPTSTVSREVARNGGAWRYRAARAQRAAQRRARRPKVRRLVS